MYWIRAEQILTATMDPSGSEAQTVKEALVGYVAFGATTGAGLLWGISLLLRGWLHAPPFVAALPLVAGGILLLVAAHVDTVVFRDYGIHFYEYDLQGMISDSMARKDLGIRPQDFLTAVGGGLAIFLVGVGTYRALAWAAPRLPASTETMAAAFLGSAWIAGTAAFAFRQRAVVKERHEFLAMLPARRILLPGQEERPHLAVRPRTGPAGYPDPRLPATPVPRLGERKNVLIVLADGLRADHVGGPLGLTPALTDFAARPEVVAPVRHYATGPFTEMGFHGLTYGLHGHACHPFLQERIPSWPLHVFGENGYEVAVITGSRLFLFPTSQLLDNFPTVVTLDRDEDVHRAASGFLQRRREDGKPYFLVVFHYAPHWPFDEIADANRRFRPDLLDSGRGAFQDMRDEAFRARVRHSYRNATLQADLNFARTFQLVRDSYEAGQTIVGFTSDHGTELWEHGIMGQGSSTFWNEKVAVPFLLGLPGVHLEGAVKHPTQSSHVDLLPTLLDYLGMDPVLPPEAFSHGRSLLKEARLYEPPVATISGRFFPWADRQNALVTGDAKYWFHAARDEAGPGGFVIVPGRATDLEDEPLGEGAPPIPEAAARRFTEEFWRFLEPDTSVLRSPPRTSRWDPPRSTPQGSRRAST